MKTTNLRNKPLDRRRLSKKDREQYNPTNRMQAVAKARARKGQLAWENSVEMGRTEQQTGTGSFTSGLAVQKGGQREAGNKEARHEERSREKTSEEKKPPESARQRELGQ